MFKLGLTGGIGSGKSTVARVFEVLGIPVFNADDEGKRILNEDPAARRAVTEFFGTAMYPNGRLDRKALATVVFHDPAALRQLNGIVHPLVREHFRSWCSEQQAPYVIMEAAILAESGGAKAMDQLVVVSAPEDVRVQRVMLRDKATESDVRARMRAQTDDAHRNALADHIIVNDGQQMVIPQVLQLHERMLTLARE
jgi:dephospho-CoA kinase